MAEVDTVGGVVVVRNGADGLWRESEQWRVVEEFRVGNVQGNPDEELATSRNNSVTLGPNGQIFVVEHSTDRVMVFGGDGGAGTLVDETVGGVGRRTMVLYLRVDSVGQIIDTVAVVPKPPLARGFQNVMLRPSQESLRFLVNHYIPRLRWSLAPDGTIWSASTGRLRLVQTTPSGDTIRVVETSHRKGISWAASTWVLAFPVATYPRSSGTRSSRSHLGFSMCPSSCAPR